MTRTSQEFWIRRLSEALDKALAAPSERSRLAYLELARHYCSMRALSEPGGREPFAPRLDSVSRAAADSVRQDFRSIHDKLMHIA